MHHDLQQPFLNDMPAGGENKKPFEVSPPRFSALDFYAVHVFLAIF